MEVTAIEEVASNRYKVFIDEQFAFVLYKGELSRYHIRIETAITQDTYNLIREEIILKRAKKRILYLLEQMARTEQQLRLKMQQNYYPEDIIDKAIEYAKSFGYLNDEHYAKSFIEQRMTTKSKREIYALLMQKGIKKETIELCLEETYGEEDSLEAIRCIVQKKRYSPEKSSEKEKQKLYSYLMRKGFSYANICQVLRVSDWNA